MTTFIAARIKSSKALYNQGEKLKIMIKHNHSLK